MRERVLGLSAVWPLVCASVSSDSRPCGRWTLAVWPLDSRRVAWPHLCTLPVPQWCPMVVNPCGDARPTMGFSLIGALPGLDQRRQGGRECAVRFWIQLGWGRGVTVRKRYRPPGPMPGLLFPLASVSVPSSDHFRCLLLMPLAFVFGIIKGFASIFISGKSFEPIPHTRFTSFSAVHCFPHLHAVGDFSELL